MAELGELTGRMRMDIREWTQPIKQATAEIRGVTQATKAATSATAELQARIARGLTSQYASVRAMAQEQQAALHAANAKALLGQRARTVMTQIAGFTASVSGATGPLGRMGQLLLSMGPGSLASLGAVAGLTAVAGAIGLLTKDSREAAASLKEAEKALDDFWRTAEEKQAEILAREEKRRGDLKRLLAAPLTGQERLAGKSAWRMALEEELRSVEARLARFAANADAAKAGTPVDRANLAVEFSQASKETAKALELLRASEKELTEASSRANVPIKEQVQLLGALRRVQERLKDMAPHKAFAAPWDMTTSAEEDIRRRNRLGSEWMEGLRKQARDTSRIVKEMDVEVSDIGIDAVKAQLDALFASARERQEEIKRMMRRLGRETSQALADGLLGSADSIGGALVNAFRAAIGELLAAIIEQRMLDPLIRLIAGAFGGGGGIPGPIGTIPIPDIPFLPFLQSPAMAAVGAGARSGPGVFQINVVLPTEPFDPVSAAQDAKWQRAISEVNRELKRQGVR